MNIEHRHLQKGVGGIATVGGAGLFLTTTVLLAKVVAVVAVIAGLYLLFKKVHNAQTSINTAKKKR